MALANYTEFVAAVADTLNRDDLASSIPIWTALCEADVNRRVLHRRMICRAQTTISTEYTVLPSNYIAVLSLDLATDPVTRLEYVTPEQLVAMTQTQDDWRDSLADDFGSDPAPPKYFTVVGDELRVFPVPEATYTARMAVYERVPGLQANATNWLLSTHPDIYLYGTLVHSAPYLKDDTRIPVWRGLYDAAIDLANRADPTPADPNVIRTDIPPLRPAAHGGSFHP